ncbi:hypothetical protein [Streptomyces pseudogriseolus]|uniref:hypothetical protein n=1 Tax=Streptomyces pseudogriseolus TaxID=36817 RepID=UPI003FA23293
MTTSSDRTRRIQTLLRQPCGCTGQCGNRHARGHCGHRPSHLKKHCAAPPDPSAPFDPDEELLSWCSTCYNAAVRLGQEARTEQAKKDLLDMQEELF